MGAFVLLNGHLGYVHTERFCSHKKFDFAAIFVTERGCTAPILKVERHISDRFCATLRWSVNTFLGRSGSE